LVFAVIIRGFADMSDALKKVQAGQKLQIPARAYNVFLPAPQTEQKMHIK
jgi:hypothetical protein